MMLCIFLCSYKIRRGKNSENILRKGFILKIFIIISFLILVHIKVNLKEIILKEMEVGECKALQEKLLVP